VIPRAPRHDPDPYAGGNDDEAQCAQHDQGPVDELKLANGDTAYAVIKASDVMVAKD